MYIYRLIFLLVLAIYIFSPTIMDWWIQPGSLWYRPFLIWLALVGLAMWLEYRGNPDDL
ncbi:MAG: hypothetical protein LPK85_07120 [Gammaproteobacteria bacterium]|nr:hypothetical protein [Gammaproteobacteria bacterium]